MDNICLKHFVSSANSNSCEVMTDGKSLMNIKKSKGPSMLLIIQQLAYGPEIH